MFFEIFKIVLKALNLFVFLYLIYYFAKKPIKEFLKNYKDEILNKRKEAEKKEEEAKKIEKDAIGLKEKLQKDLDLIKEKFEELRVESEKDLEFETKKIIEKIQKEHKLALKEKEEEAKREILSYAKEKLIGNTESILKKTLTEEEQKKYLLKIIGGLN